MTTYSARLAVSVANWLCLAAPVVWLAVEWLYVASGGADDFRDWRPWRLVHFVAETCVVAYGVALAAALTSRRGSWGLLALTPIMGVMVGMCLGCNAPIALRLVAASVSCIAIIVCGYKCGRLGAIDLRAVRHPMAVASSALAVAFAIMSCLPPFDLPYAESVHERAAEAGGEAVRAYQAGDRERAEQLGDEWQWYFGESGRDMLERWDAAHDGGGRSK
jgi:hypothetical protein